ncbi:hypothetical protein P6N53_11635 [Desulforamulus aquiferis]|uniref:Uncharacterized protein n=1 Tax=Desulforamulus aquiferis TaxID=1397668 RepID=A0AAW7ZES7_9FIRM|nr:hypothetical protein [Desulforamulus aquiferis]
MQHSPLRPEQSQEQCDCRGKDLQRLASYRGAMFPREIPWAALVSG